MLRLLSLLLPMLIPSWRFFERVEASPRVQWQISPSADGIWHSLPEVLQISVARRLCSLFWNPSHNHRLYLTSLAERQEIAPSDQIVTAIFDQLSRHIPVSCPPNTQIKFRILFLDRHHGHLVQEITYVSAQRPLAALAT